MSPEGLRGDFAAGSRSAVRRGGVTEQAFQHQYFAIDREDYGFQVSEEDYQYTWLWFQSVRDLYYRAADAGPANSDRCMRLMRPQCPWA
jgi:hypothetical protein